MDLRRIHTLGFVGGGSCLFVLKCKPHNQSPNAKQDFLQRNPFQGKLTLASKGKATFMYDESSANVSGSHLKREFTIVHYVSIFFPLKRSTDSRME